MCVIQVGPEALPLVDGDRLNRWSGQMVQYFLFLGPLPKGKMCGSSFVAARYSRYAGPYKYNVHQSPIFTKERKVAPSYRPPWKGFLWQLGAAKVVLNTVVLIIPFLFPARLLVPSAFPRGKRGKKER